MSLTLSCREQVAIAACSDTLVRPLDFPTLDAWRIAVLDVFSGLIAVDAAFFNFRRPPDGSAIALSREFTGATVRHYEQTCVNDAGFERALERRLSAMNQTMLIGGEWDLYYSDPAVCEFYLPNKVLDSLGLILDEPSAGVSASVELHASRYGTRPFGPRGVALMQLLLPSFRAGLLAISRANAVRGQLASVLNASSAALLAYDNQCQCVHQTPQVQALLREEPQGAVVLASSAHLARRVILASASRKSQVISLTAPCVDFVKTATAPYRIEATRVSSFADQGAVTLVAIECLKPLPLSDATLTSRYSLSPREITIARHVALGDTAQAIASALSISVHTTRRHTENVFTKLGVHTRAAVAAALSA